MSVSIKSGDSGDVAKVDKFNMLHVLAKSITDKHYHSETDGRAYVVHGEISLNNTNGDVLYISNTSQVGRLIVINGITLQMCGSGVTLPLNTNHFQIYYNASYTSGGTAVTPVNLNRGSDYAAEATCIEGDATFASDGTEMLKVFMPAQGIPVKLFEGESLILPYGRNILIRATTTLTTSATALAIVEFFQVESDH